MNDRIRFLFLNFGHGADHLFMLLFPTVVLALESEWNRPYSELLPLSVGGFIAFGAGAVPAGWLGDRWSRKHMLTIFFIGIGAASVVTGFAQGPISLALGLTLIGLFASIYHPVGTAMVVQGVTNVGKRLGINGVAGNLGVAAAALTAGFLIEAIHWRAAFIVPGIVSMVAGVAFALVPSPPAIEKSAAAAGTKTGKMSLGGLVPQLIFLILLVTLLGGFIFNATLVALPKVFAVRLDTLASSPLGVSGLVALVYVVGALAQILVGHLLDRYPLRFVLAGVAGLQVPFLLLASQVNEWALVLVAGAMMFTIFGAIPIQDTLVARSSSEEWRARIYALKYLVSLGVSTLAVPMVSLVYGVTGEFVWLFALFAVLSLLIVGCSAFLPRTPAPTPAPAH